MRRIKCISRDKVLQTVPGTWRALSMCIKFCSIPRQNCETEVHTDIFFFQQQQQKKFCSLVITWSYSMPFSKNFITTTVLKVILRREILSLSITCEKAWVHRHSVVVYLVQVGCTLLHFRTFLKVDAPKALTLDPKVNIREYWWKSTWWTTQIWTFRCGLFSSVSF